MRTIITVAQRQNEHSGNVFVRASKLVRVGQVLEVKPYWGGPTQHWLKVDARRNAGTAWKTFHGKVEGGK